MARGILVVNGNRTNRQALLEILRDDYRVLEAENGQAALALLRARREDVSAVLLAMENPDTDGAGMLAAMRADPAFAKIPVLATMEREDARAEARALADGANDVLRTTLHPTVVRRRLSNSIELFEAAAFASAAVRDALTGLYNREAFFARAEEMILAREPGYYVLACFDINNFKVVNDQYGTDKGDEVLRFIAREFSEGFAPAGGFCCRVMADNFAVLYPKSFMQSTGIAEIRRKASRCDGLALPITFSIGRYIVEDLTLSASAMYDRAAIAKDSIKGRYDVHIAQYDASMRERILREQRIVNEMAGALAAGQFEPWFQPQYNHGTGALIGAEALARWRHPEKGVLPPYAFIPVFERNGFIYELDKFIWERVCALLATWLKQGERPLPVSVNISRYDLFREDFFESITGLVERYGIPLDLLRLEITESAFAESTEQIIAEVRRLAQYGFTIEIDDFGSGYSSLNTLKDVPASILKLDMRFLENNENSSRGGNILESVVRMAKWLSMQVIAEGVETKAQADYLQTIGCGYVQGYLYARPMPVAEYEALAADHAKEHELSRMETLATLDNNAFWDPASMETLIFNSYVGGACILEYNNGHIELLRVNEKYVQTLGSGGMTVEEALSFHLQAHMDGQNWARLLDSIDRATRTGRESACEICLCDMPGDGGDVLYIRVTVRMLAREGERVLLYAAVFDTTAQRLAEKRTEESNEQLQILNARIASDSETLKQLMNDTPGGFCRMRIRSDGTGGLVYANDGFCELVQMPRETVEALYGDNVYAGLREDDRESALATVRELMQTGGRFSAKYRLRRGNGEYIWAMVFGRLTEEESGERFLNLYYADLSEREKQALSLAEMLPVTLAAMMESSSELSFVKDRNLAYICCSGTFAQMVGLSDAKEVVGKTDYDLFDREMAEKYRADDLRLMESGRSLVDYVEEIPSKGGITRYSSTSKYLLHDSFGNCIGLYGTGRDITENRVNDARLKLFTDSPTCGIAMFAISGEGLRPLYFSDGFRSFSGYTREEYEAFTKIRPLHLVFDEDRQALLAAFDDLLRGSPFLDVTYRCHTKDGGCRWCNMRGAATERRGDMAIVNVVQFDVTEQKAAEEALRIHEEELMLAMSQIGRMLCEYDPVTHTLTMPEAYAKRYGLPTVLQNVPETIQRTDIVDAASRAPYDAFFSAIFGGERTGDMETSLLWANGERHWEHAEFSTICNADGKPVKVVIAIEDTTERHQQYELEANRPSLGEENLLIHALFNLVTGETLEYAYGDGSPVPPEDRTAFLDGRENLGALLTDETERARFRALNDAASLLERYERGETELSLDYRRRMRDGEVIWVRNILHMVRDPGGSDILLFEYCYNVEEEKLQELTYQSLANANYDYVVRVDGKTGRFRAIARTDGIYGMPPAQGEDSDAMVRRLAEDCVIPADRETTVENTTLAGIRRNLADSERFQFTCREQQPDGSVRYKKFTEYYLDREREIIAVTREDVTAVVREEMQKNEALAAALASANQANRAKSQFLSRMSHELRTPMNAIIGLSALAAGDVNNPAAMEDAIGKIGMSARYLLSLINDILEMSRIESGRMTLTEAPFDFEQLIASVNGIIFGQASAKGVDYDAVVNSFMEPVYIGDVTKLQQILINVLGNAVKFTPTGGKIILAMEQLRHGGERATLRFVVSDTGVGIDKAFLPHLFDPFSQEAASLNAASAGTGLGLAITKTLVDMMSGQISVQSVKNVGSVFTIDVQLGISEESKQHLHMLSNMNLSKLSALVVDDDVVVCQSTENTLSTMGMRAEWVDSGACAVERVGERHAAKRDFDMIFIDWKMPDMDGIETTRRIRQIVGPDVTIIIMTAYDWRTIESQAIAAGVDMFMEKPLFQSSIVRAFEKVFSAHSDRVAPMAPAQPDFTGRRILLAEDHPLNVEVAKRLLEKIGAEVTVVNNGLEALETFTREADGYFDAILMDIRMPVMDGLSATKNIRNLKKAGGRSIPIVAMTANAFDEDVELSLSSGMDAHLNKPIEPKTLYATLQRLFTR